MIVSHAVLCNFMQLYQQKKNTHIKSMPSYLNLSLSLSISISTSISLSLSLSRSFLLSSTAQIEDRMALYKGRKGLTMFKYVYSLYFGISEMAYI